MQGMIHITVKLFGPAAEAVGLSEFEYGLAEPARLDTLLDLMYAKYPALASRSGSLRFAVNEEYAEPGTRLCEGDEVAIIPPVSGGEQSLVELTTEPIDAAELRTRVGHPFCGAIVAFEGIVRPAGTPDNPLAALEYSAYEPMAYRQLNRIRREALEQFAIREAAIVHRLGRLAIGETSVMIAVSAEHRAAAFDACRWIIDRIKDDVPIFKKEVWSRGNPTWVDRTPKEAVG